MSFLDKFDKRAQNLPPVPGELPSNSEDDQLLGFADLIRSRRALPSNAERERVLTRVLNKAAAFNRRKSTQRLWWAFSAAALIALAIGLAALSHLLSNLNTSVAQNDTLP